MKKYYILGLMIFLSCMSLSALFAYQNNISVKLIERGKDVFRQTGSYSKAEQYYFEATKTDASNTSAWYELAKCQLNCGEFEEAVKSVDTLIKIDPDNLTYHLLGAQVCEYSGHYDDGIAYAEDAVKLKSDNIDTYGELGILQILSGHRSAVKDTLIKLDALDPNEHGSGPYSNVSHLLAFTGQSPRVCYLANEEASDRSLAKFLRKFRQAIKSRDAKYLMSIVSNEISGSDSMGRTGFERDNEPEQQNSSIWPLLDGILSLHGGWIVDTTVRLGKKERRAFEMPHIVVSKPMDPVRNYPYDYIIHEGVQVKALPSSASASVATVGMQVVVPLEEIENNNTYHWCKVLTADDKSGYVKSSDLYSDTDCYATFAKENGKWLLVYLETGFDG